MRGRREGGGGGEKKVEGEDQEQRKQQGEKQQEEHKTKTTLNALITSGLGTEKIRCGPKGDLVHFMVQSASVSSPKGVFICRTLCPSIAVVPYPFRRQRDSGPVFLDRGAVFLL